MKPFKINFRIALYSVMCFLFFGFTSSPNLEPVAVVYPDALDLNYNFPEQDDTLVIQPKTL